MSRLSNWIPLWGVLQKSSKEHLRGDLIAGLTVGVMLIPQGMAYAVLAGMPPIYGLFAGTIPALVYGLLGTSKYLAVGPAAIVCLLIGSGVSQWATPGSPEYISMVLQLALLTGAILLAGGVLRLGFLSNFLSQPVTIGFTSAAAIIIISSQLKHLLGISLPRTNLFHESLVGLWQNAEQVRWQTAAVGILGMGIIMASRRIHRLIPGALIAIGVGTGLVFTLGLSKQGMDIIGEIKAGVPPFVLPDVSIESLQKLFPTALIISLIGFVQSFAVAKAMEQKHPEARVLANGELVALGWANLAGSLFSIFPVAGSFGRTAVSEQAGASSGLASIVSGLVVLVSLVFLTPLFTYLPKTILAGIIILAVLNLIGIKPAIALWRTDRQDFVLLLVAFIATLVLGVELGIATAVILSLLLVVHSTAHPHSAVLGRLPSTRHYMNINRFKEAKTDPEILVFRFDGPLFFGNIAEFEKRVHSLAGKHNEPLRLFVLDASSVVYIDSTAMWVLTKMIDDFSKRNVQFCAAFVRGRVRDTMRRSGLYEKVGQSHFFMNVADAVDWFIGQHGKDK